jgi:hypothetical protein
MRRRGLLPGHNVLTLQACRDEASHLASWGVWPITQVGVRVPLRLEQAGYDGEVVDAEGVCCCFAGGEVDEGFGEGFAADLGGGRAEEALDAEGLVEAVALVLRGRALVGLDVGDH